MPSDPRDYKVELSSAASQEGPARAGGKRFLSILFNCCRVYQRIYKTPDGTAYAGRCPKCGRAVRFPIGPGGTSDRFFVVE